MKIIDALNSFIIKKVYAATPTPTQGFSTVPSVNIGFKIPSLAETISFVIKFFFILSGLLAIIYLILGAIAWITSGGNKENVSKAQEKIQAAVIGLVILVGVLVIIVLLEQIVFSQKICLGLSCPLKIPSLIEK